MKMNAVIVIMLIVCLILSAAAVFKLFSAPEDNSSRELSEKLSQTSSELRQEINRNVQISMKNLGDLLTMSQSNSQQAQNTRLDDLNHNLDTRLKSLENRFGTLEQTTEQKLEAMRTTMSRQLTGIQEDNNKKLDSIRKTVDEKLENKMNESFRLVSERLEQVYKGLGEMQTIASGVGDLKKVLSNVKNRGILGEIQLGAILSEILAPEQYDTDVAVIPRSANRVEFAVKLPGGEDGSTVYLPIDSKFP
ncbi:MAG: DNA recombination protein RmuC, partial [Ruminococcus sp.]|nr:DNA recombination protein RmuC [Ruminococcus sp.]